MSNDKAKGFDDARSGKDPNPPTADMWDSLGIGRTTSHIEEDIKDYDKGYDVGTQQRVADSKDKDKEKD